MPQHPKTTTEEQCSIFSSHCERGRRRPSLRVRMTVEWPWKKRSRALCGLVMLFLYKEQQSMPATIPVSSRLVQALRQSSHPALRRLAVEETDTSVVITGRVSSYYLKQMAQEAIMS